MDISEELLAGMRVEALKLAAVGYFAPFDVEEAIQEAMVAVESRAACMPPLVNAAEETYLANVFKIALRSFHRSKVRPARMERLRAERLIDESGSNATLRDIGERISGVPSADERRHSAWAEICEILQALGDKTITRAFRAYIMADGNLSAAAGIARMSKSRFYRLWPVWLAKARAVAEKIERKGV